VSLKTDAETIRDLAQRIVAFEILRPNVQAGTVILFENPDAVVTLSAAQKTALLAVEDGWKATIKSISAAW
jgi:hypothetical protein